MLPSTDQQTAETIQVHQPINVAFQGERGAFSDEAVRAYFGQQAEPLPYRSFADVFRAVAAGEVDYGLVPVENSQAGSINDVYDLLRQHDLFVIGEISHPVNHCLLCLPGQQLSDIKRVISHPQALAQSDAFLRELGVEIVATYDTAGKAKMGRGEKLTCSNWNRAHRVSAPGNMSSTSTSKATATIQRYALHWLTWRVIQSSARC